MADTEDPGAELVNISSQFPGLPMQDLIGGPLKAACDAQIMLAQATSDYIETVGFLPVDPKDKDKSPVSGWSTFRGRSRKKWLVQTRR